MSAGPINAPNLRRVFSACSAALMLVALACSNAHALTRLPHLWRPNGQVQAAVQLGNVVYLGGNFGYVGKSTGPLAVTDAAAGNLLPGSPAAVDGLALAIPDGAGGWYVGGWFSQIAGQPREGLAHIRADLTLDPWAPQVRGIQTMALEGNTLYLGGSFTTVNGLARTRLAAFNVSTGALLDWDPGVLPGDNNSGEVLSLAVSGSVVYVGGWFGYCGGQPRVCLASVDRTTGLATDWNPSSGDPNAVVISIVPRGATVLVAGYFSAVGGQSRAGFAELDAASGLATPLQPIESGVVNAMCVGGTTLYVAGSFGSFDGMPRNNLAAMDLTTGHATAWNPSPDLGVQTLSCSGSTVYVGGSFKAIGGQPRLGVAALDATSGLATSWYPTMSNVPFSIVAGAQGVLLAGGFNSIGGVHRTNLAALDLTTGEPTAWNPGADNPVYTMAASGSTIYASGAFLHAGGQARRALAAFDALSGQVTAWDPNPDGTLGQMLIDGPLMYVAGGFNTIGGASRFSLAALDLATGLATSWAPSANANGWVGALAKRGSTLYVGGQFTSMDGQPRQRLAAFDMTTGTLTPWNPGTPGYVFTLAASSSAVYAGGSFSSIGGQTRWNIAALDPVTGLATAWNPSADDPVRSIAIGTNRIFASADGGRMGGANGTLAALDPATGVAELWYPYENTPGPFGLTAAGGMLLVTRNAFDVFSEAPDVTPPVVHVLTPNGGESFVVGHYLKPTRTVTDDGQVANVTAYLSRNGPTGPWEVIGSEWSGLGWLVAGPVCANNAYIKIVATDVAGNVGYDISDGPFSIVTESADTVAPVVRLYVPNGLDELAIGYPKDCWWTDTDDVGVVRRTIYLSRTGPTGPWELLADWMPNTGHYVWNVSGPTCLLTAYIRVDAVDAAGNVGSDMSDQPFSITDGPVPTFVELFRALPTVQGVRIEWKLADPAAVSSVVVQRAFASSAEWTTVTRAPQVLNGVASVIDIEAPAGQSLRYRLSGVQQDGRPFTTPAILVQSGEPITAFALVPPAPNPTAGRSLITYALPTRSLIRLSLADIQGREVALLAEGAREAGRYTAALDASDLRAGLYFVRMQAGAVQLTRRLILVR